MRAHKRHKAASFAALGRELVPLMRYQQQLLKVLRPNGRDEPPALAQLIQQRLRQCWCGGRCENAVIRSELAKAFGTVAAVHLHVREAKAPQPFSRRPRQLRPALDAVHLPREQRKYGRLVTATRTDVENFLSPL